ncbi:MAG: hypothetical protein QF918_07230 [Pirellulaceae bacterium]|nr:hypothetical protein [Pirellulaceae bacterium]MDP6555287.1 hypothetical protein [Pirellulaceae bacterium]MDP6721554.1 hypothetical protein [Pirellulaceae bacterium]
MLHRMNHKGALLFGAGLSLGLCVGVGMLIGALVSQQGQSSKQGFPVELLHASATDSTSTMAISTGHIADNIEGLFVLDFITGNLQCEVLNSRTGGAGGLFRHNVSLDLGVQQGKQPRYLMATGVADFRVQAGGNLRPAGCIVYVADANSGRYAAYMLPWNKAAAQQNVNQVYPMKLLWTGNVRNVVVE